MFVKMLKLNYCVQQKISSAKQNCFVFRICFTLIQGKMVSENLRFKSADICLDSSSYLLVDEHMVHGYGEWIRHPLFGLRTRSFVGVYKQKWRRGRRAVRKTTFSRPLWQIERKASSFGDQRGVSPPIPSLGARQWHYSPFHCMCIITSIPLRRFKWSSNVGLFIIYVRLLGENKFRSRSRTC